MTTKQGSSRNARGNQYLSPASETGVGAARIFQPVWVPFSGLQSLRLCDGVLSLHFLRRFDSFAGRDECEVR